MPAVGGSTVKNTRGTDTGSVSFTINGKPCTVNGEYDVTTSLNDFIRTGAALKGTKVLCREGGCGCCAVSVTKPDPVSGKKKTVSLNSCLCPLYSVDGWHITTVEGLGNSKDGFHPIQDRIAKFYGSQCGYCTPGMVMNMYGILQKNPQPTQREIEDQFGGNICRCTGYRPILDAMKSFASDSTIPGAACIDIEDLRLCPRTGKACEGHDDSAANGSANGSSANGSSANVSRDDNVFLVRTGGKSWYRPQTLQKLTNILQSNKDKHVRLVFGNTATGVYKNDGPYDVYIDLHEMKELSKIESTQTSYRFGSSLSITCLIDALVERAGESGYCYFNNIADHLRKIASVLVRNAGSWAGNLMIKHAHPDFPSDVFTPMEATGAQISLLDTKDGSITSYTPASLVQDVDMTGKVILSIELFKQNDKHRFRSYKIMPRSQNAHAYVNAAFSVTIDSTKFQILGKPSLVFGGIDMNTNHATKTEEFLVGRCLTDSVVIEGALTTLKSELNPDYHPVLATPEYRRNLAVNLFYKFLLNICAPSTSTLISGGQSIERPISTGQREFQELQAEWPLKEPMPKLAAPFQASGEAEFINDIPSSSRELCGAFVLTSIGRGTIDNIDPSQALLMPGVVDFISHKDIPENGKNNIMPGFMDPIIDEELFCSSDVKFAGQAVGFVLAESQCLADAAAEKVKVTYKEVKPAIVTIEDAIREESYHANPSQERRVGDPEDALSKAAHKLSGECRQSAKYHFYMESNVSLAVPSEDRIDVYSASQWPMLIQSSLCLVTGQPANYFSINVPRLGGSFGGKGMGSIPVAAATTLAAYKHRRPVRSSVSLSTNMRMSGKRPPIMATYEVGFEESGKLNAISMEIYADAGYAVNAEFLFREIVAHIDQGVKEISPHAEGKVIIEHLAFPMQSSQYDSRYYVPNWRVKLIICKTNAPPAQPMRGPGPYPAGFIIESVLEHVANALGKVPADVKETNLYTEGQIDLDGHVLNNCTIRKLWQQLRQSSDFDKRRTEVDAFNKANQWKKRGITMTPGKYGMVWAGAGMTVDIAIYGHDGTVTVSQGGIEMGQGLYTKMAQAVASGLGIPIELIRVRPVDSHIAPNNGVTGGSVGSEHSVESALRCCKILNERLAPIRAKHPHYDWKNLIKTCATIGIELSAKHKWKPERRDGPGQFQYFTYCAAVNEVELDVLTGESQIRRVDIHFDCGESLNPAIDMGQVEGAYVMGIGGYLFEEIIQDKETGLVLNDGTWEYKPPTTKDIPIDWRIKFLNDAPNPVGIRGSKASGEPPILLSSGVYYALKQAMAAARQDVTGDTDFSKSVAPLTVERIQLGCGFNIKKMVL